MITRMWRGWTTQAAADDYERFLLDELFPSIRRIQGFRGADVLRRPDGDEVAFVTLVRFEAPGDVKGFAGDDWEHPLSNRAPPSSSLAGTNGRPTMKRGPSPRDSGCAR